MSDAVLVLNAGSSSIKFGLFDISGTAPHLLCKGLLDEHEAKPGFTVTDAAGPGPANFAVRPYPSQTRASTASTPAWSASSGLMSSQGISGMSAAICASFTSTSLTSGN